MRRFAGASVLALVAILGIGATIAFAADAIFAREYNTATWIPASGDPSGITHVSGQDYLVVDTNVNVPSSNGWLLTVAPQPPGTFSVVGSGIAEPTGVHYHADSDTLFVSTDASGGQIAVFENWDPSLDQAPTDIIDTLDIAQSFDPMVVVADTEDPAFDGQVLYWVSGKDNFIYWVEPVDGVFNNGDDLTGRAPITMEPTDPLEEPTDWEAMTLDPGTSDLLLASRTGYVLYHVSIDRDLSSITVDAEDSLEALEPYAADIAGLATGPASYIQTEPEDNVWVTSRASDKVLELTINGEVAPDTTTSSTVATTTPTTAPTTTSTTTPGATTTTTTPGATTTTTTPPPTGTSGFSDIGGHTHAADIEWLAGEGITKGCNPPDNTLFCPDDSVTRGQMAAFLGRAFDYSDSGTGNYFVDTIGNTFQTEIDQLRVAGVTLGCNPPTNNRYCPDDPVTRGQMAAFLGRAFGYSDSGTGNYFVDTIGNTFQTEIDQLRVAGVTLGCNPPTNNRYCPDDPVTRGQMAAFLGRAFGYTDAGSGNFFVDTGGDTFETDIDRLRVAGVTLGCNPPTNDEYCPDDPVTRGQMATFLRRGFSNQ